ncbi:MAG TPA: TetR/AcrR family transcriptional regulator [Rhizomicrobium sp.]|nr:TetR/AcrR family transcriptional regulator [Rhizomicrobium sp.]
MARPATKSRARRMAPADRREHILDAAVTLIVGAGHARCTLEQVAAAAGVSTPLVYKYFPRREDLLTVLLDREFRLLARRGLNSIPPDAPVEQVVRTTVANALHYYFERGPIVRLLSDDPAVAELARRGNRASTRATSEYFIARFVERYGVPGDVALIAVTMVINAPILSVPRLRRRNISADLTIEVWSEFILGGWKALAAKYGRKPARRRP